MSSFSPKTSYQSTLKNVHSDTFLEKLKKIYGNGDGYFQLAAEQQQQKWITELEKYWDGKDDPVYKQEVMAEFADSGGYASIDKTCDTESMCRRLERIAASNKPVGTQLEFPFSRGFNP